MVREKLLRIQGAPQRQGELEISACGRKKEPPASEEVYIPELQI